ncbi:MAG TPA: pyridoxamine 5'-phosphate oxidase family protein [Stellaceae bacterium]|jgi:general stress protein 26|nr:pyridoxamine 5'-phosphate oxidase family protein [Stellaceae bacterium]
MSRAEDERDDVEVSRLIAGAAKALAPLRNCWLVTAAESSGAHARPMERLKRDPDESEWTIRFLTDGRSRKASELRRDGKVAVVFQHDGDDAFVTVIGTARLREEASEVRRRWKRAYDVYFPSDRDRACAAFVEVEAERLELWIRGVTPEPFGLHPTILERDAGGWRLVRARHSSR